MPKTKKEVSPYLNRFNSYIELLITNGYELGEIAASLGVFKYHNEKKTIKVDYSAFYHLRKGTRKDFRTNKIEDFIEVLEANVNYRKVLMPKSIEQQDFEYTFLWYYWSHSNEVGVAFLGINKLEKDKKIQQGIMHYLVKEKITDGAYVIRKTRAIKSFTHIQNRSIEIITSKHLNSPSAYIVADLGGESLENVAISYCSFCGSASSVQGVYSGIGILEHVNPIFIEQRLKEISKEIPSSIINALYFRRNVKGEAEPGSHENIDDLRHQQLKYIANIKGYWHGAYIRKHIHEHKSDGGLAKVLMHIDESGFIQVFVKSDYQGKPITPYYTGMLYFPDGEKESFMVGKLVPSKGLHRIRFHLNLHSDGLVGIMSGWRKDDNVYFTRVIILENIKTESDKFSIEQIASLTEEYKPKGYSKKEVGQFKYILEKIQDLELQYIHSFDNCLNRKGGVQLDLLMD